MSIKPETQLIQRVHRLLKKAHPTVYHEKMNNPFRSGTPDVWYSGPKGDCWVEYKRLPPQSNVPLYVKPSGLLSEQQMLWLRRRASEGRRVFVFIGHDEGVYISTDMEFKDIPRAEFVVDSIPFADVAEFIGQLCAE